WKFPLKFSFSSQFTLRQRHPYVYQLVISIACMSSHIDSPTVSRSGSAEPEEDDLAQFAGLIKILNPKLFPAYGLSVRFHVAEHKLNRDITCKVRLPPMSGAFNLIYRLDFSDGVSWAIRIPLSNKYGAYKELQERRIQSEVGVMQFLRRR